MTVDKVLGSFDEAVADIPDGALIGISCWAGKIWSPENTIRALGRKGARDLTIVAFGIGVGEKERELLGLVMPWYVDYGILVEQHLVRKIISGFPFGIGLDSASKQQWQEGTLEVENLPHGTLAMRLWAAGSGAGGVYVRTGVGTVVEEGKEKRDFDGKEYLLERPLNTDFGFIRAHKADRFGNVVYRGVGRACAPLIAKAARLTIAEVDEVVEPGDLDPEHVTTPGIYVHRVVQVPQEAQR